MIFLAGIAWLPRGRHRELSVEDLDLAADLNAAQAIQAFTRLKGTGNQTRVLEEFAEGVRRLI